MYFIKIFKLDICIYIYNKILVYAHVFLSTCYTNHRSIFLATGLAKEETQKHQGLLSKPPYLQKDLKFCFVFSNSFRTSNLKLTTAGRASMARDGCTGWKSRLKAPTSPFAVFTFAGCCVESWWNSESQSFVS